MGTAGLEPAFAPGKRGGGRDDEKEVTVPAHIERTKEKPAPVAVVGRNAFLYDVPINPPGETGRQIELISITFWRSLGFMLLR